MYRRGGTPSVRKRDVPAVASGRGLTRPYELPDVYEPCVALLERVGCEVWRLSQVRPTNQTPGLGDAFFVTPWNVAAWLETKRPGGTQSHAQKTLQAACERTVGPEYVLVESTQELADWLAASRHAVWGVA